MNRLADKVAVMTRAEGEVSAEMAKLFADEGAYVVLVARDTQSLEELAEEIRDAQGDVLLLQAKEEEQESECEQGEENELVKTILSECGQIDILVQNCDVFSDDEDASPRLSFEDQFALFEVTIAQEEKLARQMLPYMEEGGAIVSITPAFAKSAKFDNDVNRPTLEMLIGHTEAVARKHADADIRINVICPAIHCAEDSVRDDDESQPRYSRRDRKDKEANAEDLSNVALFLASDESRALNGQVLVTDFGTSL